MLPSSDRVVLTAPLSTAATPLSVRDFHPLYAQVCSSTLYRRSGESLHPPTAAKRRHPKVDTAPSNRLCCRLKYLIGLVPA
jgi:hypothetical protein